MDCSLYGCVRAAYRDGLCSRHYEESRRAKALPCKIVGCGKPAERVGMCNAHYRAQLVTDAPRCTVPGCGRGQQTDGLCNTHYMRLRRHGSLDVDKRAHDRGARRRHPLYESWRHYSRTRTLCQEWQDDFWLMVKTVGEKPSPRYWLRRKDTTTPIGASNWRWVEGVPSADRNRWQKEWRRRNPARSKGIDLKRKYGIDEHIFFAMLEKQNGVCAICNRQETASGPNQSTTRHLAVDHNHKTRKVRGLVCSSCNLLIGKYEANPGLLDRLVEYMHKHGA